ncbi:hypothetical protein CDL12_20094 [Handroanthus impetiginosus]|uniref:Uncharacterized protein n=1 Tax=Handroanthus impetiginosus TaxID=429701 RepID=A0A2G9GPW4_9LAMI|nr:hypothetical protein CDL12_20094 [Handroanthus impetiginosus]
MDINYAIRKGEQPTVTNTSTPREITLYKRWERSNHLSVIYIKTKISASIRDSVDQHDKVCDLLKAIDDQFVPSEKALVSALIMKFSSLRFTIVRGVREHIMQMRDLAAQLKNLEYGPIKISYNTHKDKWSINELMTMCVQEEERLVMELGESAMLAMQGKEKVQANNKEKGKIPTQTDIKKEPKCHFCKKKGHMRKNYGMQNLRKPVGSEQSIYMENKMGSHVELIGICTLVLSSGFVLNLEKIFYIPNFS